jgi:multicomponent Na+:H+ antiporter subunit B
MIHDTPLLATIGRLLYRLILVASLVVLVRGHDHPGGGFIGGLMAVAATVICAVGLGANAARRWLPFGDPQTLAMSGVLVALAAGLPALWLGLPFLTHQWGALPLGFTELKISTVLVFDLGVYLSVWGALSGYTLALLAANEPGAGAGS